MTFNFIHSNLDYQYYEDYYQDVVKITEDFVAPFEERGQNNFEPIFETTSETDISPEEFGIFPTLLPPPPDALDVPPTVLIPQKRIPTTNNIRKDDLSISTTETERSQSEQDNIPQTPTIGETVAKIGCPGGSLQACIDVCVPLDQLRAYILCVTECGERCLI